MANVYGSWRSLVSIFFKKNGQPVEVKPKASVTVTGAVTFELPPLAVGSDVLVSEGQVQSLAQKTLLSPTISGNVAGNPVFTGTPALTLSDTSNAILKGGNTTGAILSVGTNDNFDVVVEANGEVQLRVKPASATDADVIIEGVGAVILPRGTTAQRPTASVNGMKRYNIDLNSEETYQNGAWQQPSFTPPTVPFLTDWVTGDTNVFAVTHNHGTKDISVEIYDKASGSTIYIDDINRTSTSVVTLTASEAPPAGSWRVIVYAV